MNRLSRVMTLWLVIATAALAMSLLSPAVSALAKKPPHAGLWVGGGIFLSEFQGGALTRSGKPNANLRIGNPNFSQAAWLAFDKKRNLWFIYWSDLSSLPQIVEITEGDIAAIANGEQVRAKVVLADIGGPPPQLPFSGPDSIAFDASGDLWVSDFARKGIMEFLPDQIVTSGSPTPPVFIGAPNFNPGAMRFDDSANLWVAEYYSTADLPTYHSWRFDPSDRIASGTPAPSLVIDFPGSFSADDIAFDTSGNLWAAGRTWSTSTSELLMFSAADISVDGEITPSPAVTITSSAFGALSMAGGICLQGLDFDSSGDLWLSVHANGVECVGISQLMALTPAQLNTSGDLTPAIIIGQNRHKTNFRSPGQIRFGPKVE